MPASDALRVDRDSAEVCKKRGRARLERGDAAGALADFDAALRIDPGDAEAYRCRSTARLFRGDWFGAGEDARAAVALGPCPESHAQLGAVHQSLEDFDSAAAQYGRAIEINPGLFWAYLLRGNAHYHRGALAESCADYRRAFRLDPERAADQVVRLLQREAATDAAAALTACDARLRQHPGDFLTWGRRGVILLILGRDAEAGADLEAFRTRSPEDAAWLPLVIDLVLRRRHRPPGTPRPVAGPGDRARGLDEVFVRAAAGLLQL
jgi:tetratricopeptide (TPR) repeat protein